MSDYMIRQLLEQYLAAQQTDEENMNPEEMMLGPEAMLSPEQLTTYGMMPSYDLRGKPYTLTSQLNQLQDVNQLIADPMFQGMGGVGGWSQEAFAPTVTYEQVDSPEYQRWQNYLNTPSSFEGMVAAEIQGGGTPFSAIRKLQQRVQENPEGEVAQQMQMFFGARDIDGVPTGEINWTDASQAATDIDEMRSKIPPIGGTGSVTMPDGTVVPGGEIMEVDGQLVKRTEEPSELAQHFQELGLPSPFEEYTTESFMGPEFAGQEEDYANQLANTQAMRDLMSQAAIAERDYVPRDWEVQLATRPEQEEGGGGEGGGGGPSWGGWPEWMGHITDDARLQVPRPGAPGAVNNMVTAGADIVPALTSSQAGQILGPWAPAVLQSLDTTSAPSEIAQANAAVPGGLPGLAGWEVLRRGWDWLSPWGGGGEAEAADLPGEERSKLAASGMVHKTREGGPEPPPIDPEFLRQLGIEPPLPPVDPNAPVMSAAPMGPVAPDAASTYTPTPGPYYDPTTSDRRAQAQRVAMEQAVLQAGGSPADLPWSTWNEPPRGPYYDPTTSDRRAQAQRDAMAAAGPYYDPTTSDRRAQAQRDAMAAAAAAPPGAADDFYAALAEYGRTGELPDQATEDQIQQYLENARLRPRTSGAIETGERRGQRTEAQRRQLARERAPRGLQGERYEATTGTWGEGRRGRSQRARTQYRQAWLTQQAMRHQLYGAEEGYARGMAAGLRARGVTPLQQVYAQRVQNITNAGIPLQSQPGVISY